MKEENRPCRQHDQSDEQRPNKREGGIKQQEQLDGERQAYRQVEVLHRNPVPDNQKPHAAESAKETYEKDKIPACHTRIEHRIDKEWPSLNFRPSLVQTMMFRNMDSGGSNRFIWTFIELRFYE